jgi:outer membrane protein assembly factor BamB
MNPNNRSALFARSLALVLAVAVTGTLSGCGIFGGKGGPKTPTVGNRIPILSRIDSGARIDPALAGVEVLLPPAEANVDWPQAGNTADKSYGNLALSENPRRIWSVSVAGSNNKRRLAASPVIGGGRMFVMDTQGQVTSFNAATGARGWQRAFRVDGKSAGSLFGGGASYDDGKVFITTGLGEVAALEAETGNQVWTTKPAGPLRGSPTVAFESVYVMTQDNRISALNAADGKLLWNESGSSGQTGVFGVAAPAAGQGTVIAGYSTGEVSAYRYENGRTLWNDALARTSISTQVGVLTDVDADPIIDAGRVYALGQGGRMAAYELVSGQRIWELNLAGISTPAIAGDWIFTLTDDGRLLCIARTSGKVRWITQLQRFKNEKKKKNPIFWTGPVLAGGRLWMGNSRGEIVSASASDGSLRPLDRLGKSITLAPVVASGVLYFLDDSGKITAYR